MSGLSGQEIIAIRIKQGYTDDEIIESLGTRAIVLDGDEILYLSEPPARRRLAAVIREIRGATRADITAEAVRIERERRRAAGEPHGYDALATHFHCDASTIRRRLGVLEP